MLRPALPRILAVALIVAIAACAALGAWQFEKERAHDEQDARAQASTAALRFQLSTVVISLEGLRGLVEGGGRVDPSTFAPFAAYALERRGGLLAAWIPRVPASERAAYEGREGRPILQQAGSGGVARAAGRAEYFPIALTEPATVGRPLLGVDVGDAIVGLPVIRQARDSGLSKVSTVVTLPGQGTVVVLVRAVYGAGADLTTVAGRRAAFTGLVGTANRLEDIGAAVLATLPEGTTLEISQGSRVILPATGSLDGASTESLAIAGRNWTVRVAGAPGPSMVLPATILAAGLLLALLVWLLMSTVARRQSEAEAAAVELAAAADAVRTMNTDLERRVAERTAELGIANRELEAFSYSVSHDLRAPLRSVGGLTAMLVEDHGDELDPEARGLLHRIRAGAERMGVLIDDLLGMARVSRAEMHREPVDLGAIGAKAAETLRESDPDREVEVRIADGLTASADPRLMRVVLDNLLGNAWKFTRDQPHPVLEIGAAGTNGDRHFYVRDNGAGFDMAYVDKLFGPFQRLHHTDEFEGTGIGLATVERIVRRHGGEIWAEGEVGDGATVSFTLPDPKAAR